MKYMKRAAAMLLVVALMLGNFVGVVGAETPAYNGIANKTADYATVNNWEDIFLSDPVSTEVAGGLWTDKSVFETAEDYLNATSEQETFTLSLDADNNFLVALSAIASTKSIVGHDSQPTDTMFILDVSGSMSGNRASRMVEAANDAIEDLLKLNNYNRIGVVLYSGSSQQGNSNTGTAMVLLPLDRYTRTVENGATVMSDLLYMDDDERISANRNVKNSDGDTMPTGQGARKTVTGGTYIQNGIYQAMLEMTAEDNETVIADGLQAGTTRLPMMVLMSDGAPTAATNSYAQVGTSNMGDGTDTDDEIAFVTQLTAAYAKQQVQAKYQTAVRFYTLGLGVGNDAQAMSVMQPSESTADIDEYWDEYQNDSNNDGYVNLSGYDLQQGQGNTRDVVIGHELEQNYVDRYFPANSANALAGAFEDIVQEIILQSMYYPTAVENGMQDLSGYVEFTDYIGQNMEVKHVHGVQHGGVLYTGENFARLVKYGLGTAANPTDEGNEAIWSLMHRLNLGEPGDSVATQIARDLITKAWQSGQLAYQDADPDNIIWSNYIGWFADANGAYLGFWDGTEAGLAEADDAAMYAMKEYGLLGEVGEGHRATDMLYATIQLRTDIVRTGETPVLGEQTIHGKLPASLIPMIHYQIELDTDDPATAENITMTVEENTPSRLLYEVGIHSDIDLLDIAGTAPFPLETDANGDYVFYTNQWERTYTDISEADPSYDHNTFVYFVPSEENERYVYHETTPVYVSDGQGGYVRYTGSEAPAGDGFYHAHYVYTAAADGSAEVHVHYSEIPAAALTADTVEQKEGLWYIIKGTVHLYETRTPVEKEGGAGGPTETLPYSEYPVVHIDDVRGYHLDAILGNNGKLTVNAPEGIKLTKLVDDTLTDPTQVYTFTLQLTGAADGSYPANYEAADGTRTDEQVVFTNGQATVELLGGESVYVILPAGAVVTITETETEAYKLVSVNGDPDAEEAVITVVEDTIHEAVFLNTKRVVGAAEISKTVVSSLEEHFSPNFKFSFTVTVTGAEPETTYETVYITAEGETAGPNLVTDTDGSAVIEIALGHNEALLLPELPDGAVVTAVEETRPGFTSNYTDNTTEAVVVTGETVYLDFVNTYSAEPTDLPLNVTASVSKLFEGREWEPDDTFTFELQKYVAGTGFETISSVTIDAASQDQLVEFVIDEFNSEAYTEAGTYTYRIVENAGNLAGVTYDSTAAYFDVVVVDNGEGKLVVSQVVGYNAEVTGDAENGWTVTADFHNVYSAEGSIQISLAVSKTLENETGAPHSLEGFRFALYPADEDFNPVDGAAPVVITTNGAGVADFEDILFTEEGTYRYVLMELDDDAAGITYDGTVYEIEVVVTSDPDTATLIATVYVNGQEQSSGESIHYTAAFENIYKVTETETELSGVKTLTGRELGTGEFTFELYHASAVGVIGEYITEVTNDGTGFRFADLDALTFTTAGTYYFAIKEKAGDLGGVNYDGTVYYATVTVTANADAQLVAAVTYTDANGHPAQVNFRNTYKAAKTTADITATKTLTGRDLATGSFTFELYELGGTEPILTAVNGSGATVNDVLFTLEFTEAGTYTYIVREKIPTGDTHGITYDTAEYTVVVTVTDNLDGTLTAVVSYPNGAAAFENVYSAKPVTPAAISGEKELFGMELEAGMFTFELYETDLNYVPVSDTPIQTVTNNADGSFAFEPIEYTAIGGYHYIVVEKQQVTGDIPSDTITYDTTVYCVVVNVVDNGHGELVASVKITVNGREIGEDGVLFTNRYAPKEVFTDLGLSGEKILEGGLTLTEGMFEFSVYASDENGVYEEDDLITTVSNAADGSIHFGTFDFEQAGVYWFVIKEEPGDLATVDYDETEYLLQVEVTDVNGQLQAEITKINGEPYKALVLTFTNTHTPEGVGVTLSGEKTLTGRDLVDGEFTFELYETGADFLIDEEQEPLQTVVNAGGEFTFEELTYSTVGVHYYVVKEQAGTAEGVVYDTTVYYVTVTVENVDGTLVTTVDIRVGTETKENLAFANTYNAPVPDPDPIIVELPVVKIMEDRGGSHTGVENFKFELLNEKGEVVAVVVSDSRGKAVFKIGSFDYDDVGKVFTYYIREVNTGLSDVIYSTKVYTVRISIHESDGALYALIWKDGVLMDSDDAFVFTNVTVGETPSVPTPSKPVSPDTGDESMIPWIVSLAVSLFGLMSTAFLFFRRKTE